MRMVVVRHGEPNYEKDCLTELGCVQAGLAAKRLMREGIGEVYSSPMGRARQTAQAFCDLSGIEEMKILDFMHEIRWGSVSGEPIFEGGHPWSIADEMMRRGEDLKAADWREHPVFFADNLAVAECEKVAKKADEWLKEFGYEREGLYYRCVDSKKADRTIALFCHGGSSTALFAHLLNTTFPYLCAAIHMDFTGITTLRFDSRHGSLAMPILELVSDDYHIKG